MASVLERGDLSVFYRPRVQAASAREDRRGVQAMWLVLSVGERHRRVRVGKNHLPSRAGQRFLVMVERVGSFDRVIGDQLEAETYVTKTRGARFQPGARLIARGEYALVAHDDHRHLSYRVDHTEDPDDLPEEVRVPTSGSFVLLFKNRVGRATWTAAGDPVAALDTIDAELVLVAAGDDDSPTVLSEGLA